MVWFSASLLITQSGLLTSDVVAHKVCSHQETLCNNGGGMVWLLKTPNNFVVCVYLNTISTAKVIWDVTKTWSHPAELTGGSNSDPWLSIMVV